MSCSTPARNPAELGIGKATHAAVRTMIKHIPIGLRWLLVLLIALTSALEANTAAGNDDAMIGKNMRSLENSMLIVSPMISTRELCQSSTWYHFGLEDLR